MSTQINEASSEHASITATTYQPGVGVDARYRLKLWHIPVAFFVLVVLFCVWFLFTSKSVQLDFTPPAEVVAVSGGFSFELAGVWLLREGQYQIQAKRAKYHDLAFSLEVGDARNQRHDGVFIPLPGYLHLTTVPEDAQLRVNGDVRALQSELPAGTHTLELSHPRYQTLSVPVEIKGQEIVQQLSLELEPNWANVAITSQPHNAQVFIDGEPWPTNTPTTIEALAGDRLIEVRLSGFKTHRQRIFAQAKDNWALEPVNLVQADAQLEVSSTPSGAGVLLNGAYIGKTPMLLDLKSATSHTVQIVQAGYATSSARLRLERGQQLARHFRMNALTGTVKVTVLPVNAQIFIDGKQQPKEQSSFDLPLRAHTVRIALDGYAPFNQSLTPKNGLIQELKVKLLTHEEARLAALKPTITTSSGQNLKLFTPHGFTMGASRRQPGRRANETLREVELKRLFYLATHETSNAQFRQFATGHDSGAYVDSTLNEDDQPAANLTWHDAAAYCNWLSEKDGLQPFYDIEFGKVIAMHTNALGYRLPTEAEWSWAARVLSPAKDPLKFPWGENLPPPDRHGNYADRAASSLVGRIIFGYNDNYPAAAPVGTYKANHRGLYDMGGNVAEWTNDYYGIPSGDATTDPTGPSNGDYHVMKGPSWMHGTVTELRYSFRDYGIDGRQDVGFRIARSAE